MVTGLADVQAVQCARMPDSAGLLQCTARRLPHLPPLRCCLPQLSRPSSPHATLAGIAAGVFLGGTLLFSMWKVSRDPEQRRRKTMNKNKASCSTRWLRMGASCWVAGWQRRSTVGQGHGQGRVRRNRCPAPPWNHTTQPEANLSVRAPRVQAVVDAIGRYLPGNRAGLSGGALKLLGMQTGERIDLPAGRLLAIAHAVACCLAQAAEVPTRVAGCTNVANHSQARGNGSPPV